MEKECKRNVEIQWICGSLVPNYHSIADFKKVNGKALINMFKLFVSFKKETDLIGGKTIAIDGTKSRAHNSKKNNFTADKLNRHFKYTEEKTNQYLDELDKCEVEEDEDKIEVIEQKLQLL